ncbi:hypothetical protein PybrP1_000868 [[Pythium] brassicae (nom. inval.)]|nr:hypothetical protein PybrP1_000868 [[Pythium] brassicae (nom. inval.)]
MVQRRLKRVSGLVEDAAARGIEELGCVSERHQPSPWRCHVPATPAPAPHERDQGVHRAAGRVRYSNTGDADEPQEKFWYRTTMDSIKALRKYVKSHTYCPDNHTNTAFLFGPRHDEGGLPTHRDCFTILHADATFMLSDIRCPAITCGFTDRASSYQLAAVFVVRQRTARDYRLYFEVLVRVFQDMRGRTIQVDAVMSYTNGAHARALIDISELGQPNQLTCFFHVLYNAHKRTTHLSFTLPSASRRSTSSRLKRCLSGTPVPSVLAMPGVSVTPRVCHNEQSVRDVQRQHEALFRPKAESRAVATTEANWLGGGSGVSSSCRPFVRPRSVARSRSSGCSVAARSRDNSIESERGDDEGIRLSEALGGSPQDEQGSAVDEPDESVTPLSLAGVIEVTTQRRASQTI